MYKTKNDLPEKTREQVTTLLNQNLAEGIDVFLMAKQAHWNVKGPNFIALHELFDGVFETLEEHIDLIAERVVQLGGFAEGTIEVAAKRTQIKNYPLAVSDGMAHVDYLSTAVASLGKRVRMSIDHATELKDADSADVLTEVSRGLDKQLWFLEAHLQK